MTHDVADFEPSLWEGFEYFPYTIDAVPCTLSYSTPQPSAQLSFQQPAPAVTPVYDRAMDGTYPRVSGPAVHPVDPEIGLARGHICTVEPGNVASGPMMDLQNSVEDHQLAQTSPPPRQPFKGKRSDGRRAGHSPRSRCAPAKAKIVGQSPCGWIGCTSKRLYSYEGTLWRHIKEKHLEPHLFKCPAPHCDRTFGRNDKLTDHRRSVHQDVHPDFQGPRQGHCHSCHEEPDVGCWSSSSSSVAGLQEVR